MPKTTDSFSSFDPESNIHDTRSTFDYYNPLVMDYQTTRLTERSKTADANEKTVLKSRYTDRPDFISHDYDGSTALFFVNRQNGYAAYSPDLPLDTLNPFDLFTPPTLTSYTEYLAWVWQQPNMPLFTLNNQLSCYATIVTEQGEGVDVRLITHESRQIPLLYFAERYVYTSNENTSEPRTGRVVLYSPYYAKGETITLDVYTADSADRLPDGEMYIRTSAKDTSPSGKIPGEPIYKTLFISGVSRLGVTAVKIGDTEIALTEANKNTVIAGTDNRFQEGKIFFSYQQAGQVEIGFVSVFKDPLMLDFTLDVALKTNDGWQDTKAISLFLYDNDPHSLTPSVTVVSDSDKIYLDTPERYTLTVMKRYFLSNVTQYKSMDLIYKSEVKEGEAEEVLIPVPVTQKTVQANQVIYLSDYVTVPYEKGKVPDVLRYSVSDIYNKINNFPLPVWVYGYSQQEIAFIPENTLQVTTTFLSSLSFKEASQTTFDVKFAYKGKYDLTDVVIRDVSCDYEGYFVTDDFSLAFVSQGDYEKTYRITVNRQKRPFSPSVKDLTKLTLRFNFTGELSNGAFMAFDTARTDVTLTYVNPRWQLKNVSVDTIGKGSTFINYQLYDNAVGTYSDPYSLNTALQPQQEGAMTFSTNVTPEQPQPDWDIRNKRFRYPVTLTQYGDITLQFVGRNATSDKITVTHNEPAHPLTVTVSPQTAYVGRRVEVIFTLKYADTIKRLYSHQVLLATKTPQTLENTANNTVYLTVKTTPDGLQINRVMAACIPEKTGALTLPLQIDRVNDYDYTGWPSLTNATITVQDIPDNLQYTFTFADTFVWGENNTGTLDIRDKTLSNAKILATVTQKGSSTVIATPNFNPIDNALFQTDNLLIASTYETDSIFVLNISVYQVEDLETQTPKADELYAQASIEFKVES